MHTKPLDRIKDELKNYSGREIKVMEVCGTHTSSIFKNGIRSLISPRIRLVSGPGCPVCVTPPAYIDALIRYMEDENTCVLTFGDMMKVKGSMLSLTEAKAEGGRVQILYSPLAALKMAIADKDTRFIFAAVGFDTTAPVYALMIDEMQKNRIQNLKLLLSVKTMLPALKYLCETEERIDAFLCPGHVSVITGCAEYKGMAEIYRKPFVVAGFEGVHILAALDEIVHQIEQERYSMKNLYVSAVTEEGNRKAAAMTDRFFERTDAYWRGIGIIPGSGLKMRTEYIEYDAGSTQGECRRDMPDGCRCREIILGRLDPPGCPLFGTACTPQDPVGPCMISSEGTCGIWYRNRGEKK